MKGGNYSNHPPYHEISILGDDGGTDMEKACVLLHEALALRDTYKCTNLFRDAEEPQSGMSSIHSVKNMWNTTGASPTPRTGIVENASFNSRTRPVGAHHAEYTMDNGVMKFTGQQVKPPGYKEYKRDVETIFNCIDDHHSKSTCKSRITILKNKFEMHRILNDLHESKEAFHAGGDFYSAMKVDNSVRLATAIDCESLLKFIHEKCKSNGNEKVYIDDSNHDNDKTLTQLLNFHGVTDPSQLTVEGLGLQPGPVKRFHRFDIFSKKHSKGGTLSVEILHIFLKNKNPVNGKYFAEIVKTLIQKNDASDSSVATEYKVPIFGGTPGEWDYLGNWIKSNDLFSSNNRYIIQIPRIGEIRKFSGLYQCATMQQQLDFIFKPLWEASVHPKSHPILDEFLQHVSAINVISDETTRGQELPECQPPDHWAWDDNPPDIFFNYYIWANLFVLNEYRQSKGLNTFQYRPNCGEVGNLDHLVSAFLLADSVNHGIRLTASPVLQYLFYMAQIGIVLSPLANNGLYINYSENPFMKFFKCGLRVSLATDDPLHFHHTKEPLIEEYGTAAKIYRLTDEDLCEIARNSVISSGFPDKVKSKWLRGGIEGEYQPLNNKSKSMVGPGFAPSIRLHYRDVTYNIEKKILVKKYWQIVKKGYSLGRIDSHDLNLAAASSIDEERGLKFQRVEVRGPQEINPKICNVAPLLRKALEIRKKYVYNPAPPCEPSKPYMINTDYECKIVKGVPQVTRKSQPEGGEIYSIHSIETFLNDYNELHDLLDNPDVQALAYNRLRLLEHNFSLHCALNYTALNTANDASRDFYKAHKVDTHVHMSAGMTAKQLLLFLVDKATNHSDDIVDTDKKGRAETFGELLDKFNIVVNKLTVDSLNVQADASLFNRFDLFKLRYNLLNNKQLRDLVLRPDNDMGGRYFAELIKKTFKQFEEDEFTFAENRISIYGKSEDEWRRLADWFHIHGMASKHNKWLIQIPRTFEPLKKAGKVTRFSEVLRNLFLPLWEISIDPNSNAILDHFLTRHVSGFDSVDNESNIDLPFNTSTPKPEDWKENNPPYGYWMYYLWVNITVLNMYRADHGRSTFTFRPHCGESGSVTHLLSGYMVGNHINHGINMRNDPIIEYLYYLSQTGAAVAPLSNTYLFLEYINNPFPIFFSRGLNVSLSTDDPLQFHHTQEPLIEEYSIASKQWKLSSTDMCEIARASVLQSGYDHAEKEKWLGRFYFLHSSIGNDEEKSRVPSIRIQYRFEVYHDEIDYLQSILRSDDLPFPRAMLTIAQEQDIMRQIEIGNRKMSSTVSPSSAYLVDKSRVASVDETKEEIVVKPRQSTIVFEKESSKTNEDIINEELTRMHQKHANVMSYDGDDDDYISALLPSSSISFESKPSTGGNAGKDKLI